MSAICKYCKGRGCVACPGEIQRFYEKNPAAKEALENPFSVQLDNESDMEILKRYFSAGAITDGTMTPQERIDAAKREQMTANSFTLDNIAALMESLKNKH